jgi:hypothetical protein
VSRRGRLRFCSVNGKLAKEIKGSPASPRITRKLSPRRGDDRVELALGGGEVQTTSCATYDRFRPRAFCRTRGSCIPLVSGTSLSAPPEGSAR